MSEYPKIFELSKVEAVREIPEEWANFLKEFDDVYRKLQLALSHLNRERQNYFWKKIEYKQELSLASVNDIFKYLAYHRSFGGSTSYDQSPQMDFEGEHSLLDFYKETLREVEVENKIS